jgi:hypothetical protein
MAKHRKATRIEEVTWIYSPDIFIVNEPSSVVGTIEIEEFELPETEDYAILTTIDRERADKAYPKPKLAA